MTATISSSYAVNITGGTGVTNNAPTLPPYTTDAIFLATAIGTTLTTWMTTVQPLVSGGTITSNANDLNLLSGMAAAGLIQADLTKLHAITATAAELNSTSGASSNFQTQITARAQLAGVNTFTAANTFSVANANITISPTGTGQVIISPGTAGTMDRMNIGATTRGTGAFTTLSAGGTTAANSSLSVTTVGSAVNLVQVSGAIATAAPVIAATGTDTNIGLSLIGQGTGVVTIGGTGTATASGGAATSNTQSGTITSESIVTAAGTDYVLTLSNNRVTATSIVLATVDNGTNSTEGLAVNRVTPSSNQVIIRVRNTHASSALNGTIKINYQVMK